MGNVGNDFDNIFSWNYNKFLNFTRSFVLFVFFRFIGGITGLMTFPVTYFGIYLLVFFSFQLTILTIMTICFEIC